MTTHNSLERRGDAFSSTHPKINLSGGEVSPVELTFACSSPTLGVAKQRLKGSESKIRRYQPATEQLKSGP